MAALLFDLPLSPARQFLTEMIIDNAASAFRQRRSAWPCRHRAARRRSRRSASTAAFIAGFDQVWRSAWRGALVMRAMRWLRRLGWRCVVGDHARWPLRCRLQLAGGNLLIVWLGSPQACDPPAEAVRRRRPRFLAELCLYLRARDLESRRFLLLRRPLCGARPSDRQLA